MQGLRIAPFEEKWLIEPVMAQAVVHDHSQGLRSGTVMRHRKRLRPPDPAGRASPQASALFELALDAEAKRNLLAKAARHIEEAAGGPVLELQLNFMQSPTLWSCMELALVNRKLDARSLRLHLPGRALDLRFHDRPQRVKCSAQKPLGRSF
jgi:hypothetical protein